MVDGTLATAVTAVVVAAIVAAWNIYNEIVRNRPRLKVTASHGRLATNPAMGPATGWIAKGGRFTNAQEIGEEVTTIDVANVGHRHVTVAQAGIELKDGKRLAFLGSGTEFPCQLAPGQAVTIRAEAENLAKSLAGGRLSFPYCIDAVRKVHQGRFDEYFLAWIGQSGSNRERTSER